MDASRARPHHEGGDEVDRLPVGDPYPPYGSLSDDELDALAAVLRASVLGKRFSVTAAA
jgi:hypothetical protein